MLASATQALAGRRSAFGQIQPWLLSAHFGRSFTDVVSLKADKAFEKVSGRLCAALEAGMGDALSGFAPTLVDLELRASYAMRCANQTLSTPLAIPFGTGEPQESVTSS